MKPRCSRFAGQRFLSVPPSANYFLPSPAHSADAVPSSPPQLPCGRIRQSPYLPSGQGNPPARAPCGGASRPSSGNAESGQTHQALRTCRGWSSKPACSSGPNRPNSRCHSAERRSKLPEASGLFRDQSKDNPYLPSH